MIIYCRYHAIIGGAFQLAPAQLSTIVEVAVEEERSNDEERAVHVDRITIGSPFSLGVPIETTITSLKSLEPNAHRDSATGLYEHGKWRYERSERHRHPGNG